MAKQIVNIGSAPDDGTGDTIRDSFDICNDNFTELYDSDYIIAGINDQSGTTYTLTVTDIGKVVRCANANAITVTIPKYATIAIPVNSVIHICQAGAGQITVSPFDVDVILNGALKTWIQYAYISLVKIDTNVWDVIGGIT